MPDVATYLAFLASVLVYQLSGPGPDMLLVMSRGIRQGWRAGLAAASGCVAAGVIQIPLLVLGLASLIAASPIAYEVLRWTGAGYLFYLGLRLIFSAHGEGSGSVGPAGGAVTRSSAFRQGMVCNLTNPTALAFMLAILPQFTDPARGAVAPQLLVLGATMKATGMLTLGSVALASGAAGGWLARHPMLILWQERFAGLVMIAFAIRVLVAGGGAPQR